MKFLYDRITLFIGVIAFFSAVFYKMHLGTEITPKDVSWFTITVLGYLVIFVAKIEWSMKNNKCPGAPNVPKIEKSIESIQNTSNSLENTNKNLCATNQSCKNTVELVRSFLPKQEIDVLLDEDEILEDGKNLCKKVDGAFCWFNVPLGRIWREENFKSWLLPALENGKPVHFILDEKWEPYWNKIEELVSQYCPTATKGSKPILTKKYFPEIDSAYAVKIAHIGTNQGIKYYRGQFWILSDPFTVTEPDFSTGEKINLTEPKIIFSFKEDFNCIPLLLQKIGQYWQGFKNIES